MNPRPIWLIGALANHARGKVVTDASGAIPVGALPADHGMCMAFGSEFQELDEPGQRHWLEWAEFAGRTLLLIPPFKVAESTRPTAWRIYRPQKAEPASTDMLGKLLASEIRLEIGGSLQVAVEVGGAWKGGGIHTAYYRKHPHSGLFAVTCLPLWSLTVLDHRSVVHNWLSILNGLAGEPAPTKAVEEPSADFRPKPDHFALMLHLCERTYSSNQEAMDRLADSPVFAIPADAAGACLQELESAGLVSGSALTDLGRSVLLESRYAVYATAIGRNRT